MAHRKTVIEPDIEAVEDRGEDVAMMEPMLLSEGRLKPELIDLALSLTKESAALKSGIPKYMLPTLADLVRAMNCYYSNLIEGHNTHPVDIKRALENEYSEDPRKRATTPMGGGCKPSIGGLRRPSGRRDKINGKQVKSAPGGIRTRNLLFRQKSALSS